MKLIPRSWVDFQHYKDRRPPWVKLHRTLIDNRKFQRLPLASRALAPMLWLLASESLDGTFDASLEELEYRLRQPRSEISDGLQPLVTAGFFDLVRDDASTVLAERQQVAIPETETKKETEKTAQDKPATPTGRKVTFATWCEAERTAGRRLIADWQPLQRYMEATALTDDLVMLAWQKFKDRYTHDPNNSGKRYIDWRAVFMNAL